MLRHIALSLTKRKKKPCNLYRASLLIKTVDWLTGYEPTRAGTDKPNQGLGFWLIHQAQFSIQLTVTDPPDLLH